MLQTVYDILSYQDLAALLSLKKLLYTVYEIHINKSDPMPINLLRGPGSLQVYIEPIRDHLYIFQSTLF